MEQILEKLFESVPKIRILRLFMQNTETSFTLQEIVERSRIRQRQTRQEVTKLLKIGILKKKKAHIKYEIKRKSSKRVKPPTIITKTKKAIVYYVNHDFPFLHELNDLITKSSVASRTKLLRQIKGLGSVKLAILCGIFIHNTNARTDLLLVGDKIKTGKLDRFLSQLESDLGRSIQYTLMSTNEFKYRVDMYDRFIRDILEFPHEKLINRLRI